MSWQVSGNNVLHSATIIYSKILVCNLKTRRSARNFQMENRYIISSNEHANIK